MRERIRRPEHREQHRSGQAGAAPRGILALQRSAGNRAVTAWLARQAAPALPAVASGLQHFIDGRTALTALVARPAPAVDARALNIPAAVTWLTGVNTTLAPLSSPSELIFESTVVSGHDAEYAEAERVTKDAFAVLEPATHEFATRLRDAIVASINTSSVIDHSVNPELGTLDHAKQLRETATALAALDPMLGFKDAAQICEDAALALLQARSVNEARTTWRADTLRSDAANAGRPQNEVDDVIADSGFGNNQSVGDDWCGMFASANMFRAAAFDKQLRVAFAHTDNVYDYFHYSKKTSDRTPVSVWAEGQWWDLETYHSYRGLPRTFIEGPERGVGHPARRHRADPPQRRQAGEVARRPHRDGRVLRLDDRHVDLDRGQRHLGRQAGCGREGGEDRRRPQVHRRRPGSLGQHGRAAQHERRPRGRHQHVDGLGTGRRPIRRVGARRCGSSAGRR